jgi:hypothetical protein
MVSTSQDFCERIVTLDHIYDGSVEPNYRVLRSHRAKGLQLASAECPVAQPRNDELMVSGHC